MTTTDTALWRALQPLRSAATWLMTGAHPDDEWNGFLAFLAYGIGVHTVYACATRGEGGQNALGPERGRLLGALRSREMERAAQEITLSLRWLGAGATHGEDDPIHDFGFSKSGEDTLHRWGAARLRDRLVRLIRTDRPDAISPTFLDVPGQHGHHRAITRTTLEAASLATDPTFLPDLPPWRVAKIYLPAFSGAGPSYDDEQPPPPETIRVDLGVHCDALGESWAQLGERSRRHHASQGMGRDLPDGPRPFPLHLATGTPDTTTPMDALPHRLADFAALLPRGPAATALTQADAAIADARAAFPDRPRIATALHRALAVLNHTDFPAENNLSRRVALKRRQLAFAAAQALGIGAELTVPPLRAGTTTTLALRTIGPATARLRTPASWPITAHSISIPADAPPFGTLRDSHDPLGANEHLGATLHWSHDNTEAALDIDPPTPLTLAPAREATLTPRAAIRRTDSPTPLFITLDGAAPPPTWPVLHQTPDGIELALPPGRTDLPSAGLRLRRTGPAAIIEPATASLLRAPIAIDAQSRIGLIAGEADETLPWLHQLDIAAEPLDDAALAGDLSRFHVLLVGMHGFGQRPALHTHRDRMLAWTHAGGSLVTLYHRPGDGWHAGRTPPLPLVIGSPSLRWRVTDPAAPVTLLAPDHPLLTTPNRITPADWHGWVRERGLYFAASWHPAYTPLLSLSDPGEPPLHGALLAAPYGRGRHVHAALALHHQFPALVPGAFRLLANLAARPPG